MKDDGAPSFQPSQSRLANFRWSETERQPSFSKLRIESNQSIPPPVCPSTNYGCCSTLCLPITGSDGSGRRKGLSSEGCYCRSREWRAHYRQRGPLRRSSPKFHAAPTRRRLGRIHSIRGSHRNVRYGTQPFPPSSIDGRSGGPVGLGISLRLLTTESSCRRWCFPVHSLRRGQPTREGGPFQYRPSRPCGRVISWITMYDGESGAARLPVTLADFENFRSGSNDICGRLGRVRGYRLNRVRFHRF